VVVCCHNSAQRLPQTLAHLVAQQVSPELKWEVIVIDNASTDATSEVALRSWPAGGHPSLRVVPEAQAGLTHARLRGFAEANYEILSFIDDDNWVCPKWVDLVAENMTRHPEAAACGGFNEAVFEATPPAWFERYLGCFAIGSQIHGTAAITQILEYLWGAGMSIRRSAWRQLLDRGFQQLLGGRVGASLMAGEDTELCYALRLAGWSLVYDPRLKAKHYLPAGRLTWAYLRRMYRGFGGASVGLDPYTLALEGPPTGHKGRLEQTWQWQMLRTLRVLSRYRGKIYRSYLEPMEGDHDVIQIERLLGRLSELNRRRGAYDASIRQVRHAPWAQTPGQPMGKLREELAPT